MQQHTLYKALKMDEAVEALCKLDNQSQSCDVGKLYQRPASVLCQGRRSRRSEGGLLRTTVAVFATNYQIIQRADIVLEQIGNI